MNTLGLGNPGNDYGPTTVQYRFGTAQKLKPCPFCGSKEVAYSRYISGTDVEGIECSGCGITFVPTAYDECTAIEEWNRRVELSDADILAIVNGWLDCERFMCDLPQDE